MRTPQSGHKINKIKNLRIEQPRFPFSECTNMQSKATTSKQTSIKKHIFPSNKTKSKQIDASIINFDKSLPVEISKDTLSPKESNANKGRVAKNKVGIKNHPNMNCEGKSKASNKYKKKGKEKLINIEPNGGTHDPLTRPSIPLPARLRKGAAKNYLESTLEESTNQCTPDKPKSKLPIYRQQIPNLPKINPKDPYALDIIDTNEVKQKKKRSSALFNKTIYNIMEKIEKKERKITKKKKVKKITTSYEEKIQNVLKNVLNKVNKHGNHSVDDNYNSSNSKPETETNVTNDTTKTLHIEDGFRGFDNSSKTISSTKHLTLLDSLDISARSMPDSSKLSQRINIISNISLGSIGNSVFTRIANTSYASTSCKGIETNEVNTTSFAEIVGTTNLNITSDVNPLDKSRNLHREFHDNISLFDEHSLDEDCASEFENYVEDEDDEFFGFQDEDDEEESKKVHKFHHKKKAFPWRFQGYFKRNPHILKLKKNGLPCKDQEMVLDYEFVKRIEALCSNKSVESSNVKNPVQTTILDYMESTHDYPDEPARPSLFDYEEFNVAKVPRKVLGMIQNNKIISTPTRTLQAVISSPNVSIIPSEENEENVRLRSPRKSYNRKCVQNKEEENGDKLNEDVLPSILEDNNESPQDGDVHLFEDVDADKETDFSIKLPILKYGQKKRRKRQISEGSDDEKVEKISKKKKKNMMTKAEEVEFNAWADKMNARFAEEDKHELTIE